MKFTPAMQRTLERLPLVGGNVLVDARFDDAADAVAFISFLRQLVGGDGTILMPAFTHAITLLDESPEPVAYHNDLPVNADLGAVPESFRRSAATLRSGHPTNSFTTSGPRGHEVLSTNRDNNPLGPVKKLNLMNGLSLRIGQPLGRSTPIHLAELQCIPGLRYRGTAKRINVAGYEERVVVEHVATCTVGYDAMEDLITATVVTEEPPGQDGVHLIPLREVMRAVAAAIKASPEAILCGRDDCRSCAARRTALDRGR